MSTQQVDDLLPDSKVDDIILVVHYHEMKQLASLDPHFLVNANVNRCDLLILLDEDLPLFLVAGPFVEKHAPWHLDEVTRLSRPLSTMGASRSMRWWPSPLLHEGKINWPQHLAGKKCLLKGWEPCKWTWKYRTLPTRGMQLLLKTRQFQDFCRVWGARALGVFRIRIVTFEGLG